VNKRIVIGFGTGRCGTKSLARFLDQQPNVTITHEHLPSMFPQWGNYFDYMSLLLKYKESFTVGNIAYAWIEYIDRILTDFEDARVICIDRNDDEAVVESFWSYMYDMDQYGSDPLKSWPFFGQPTKERIADAVYLYKYKQRVLLAQFPQILHVFTRDLNDRFKQFEILEHIGVPEDKMILKMGHENKREDMKIDSK
jgi:hypothetical protein